MEMKGYKSQEGARVKPGGNGNGSGNRERVKPGAGNHAHNEFELEMFQVYSGTVIL